MIDEKLFESEIENELKKRFFVLTKGGTERDDKVLLVDQVEYEWISFFTTGDTVKFMGIPVEMVE